MSETESNTPEVTETTPAPEPAPAPAKPRKRKWRRRLVIAAIVLVALVVIGRLSVSVLLPPVLNKVAGQFGLSAKYDRLELYAGGGDIGLWNLRFTPIGSDEPILQTAYCRGSVSLWGLVRGKLHVKRVEAEDAALIVERAADGSLPAFEQFLKRADAPKPVPEPKSAEESGELSLDPPLKIDVVRLQNARAHVRDLSQQPAVDASVQVDMLLSDVGSADKETRMELRVYSPEALGALYVTVVGDSRDNQLQADLDVTLLALNLEPARAYLEPLGIVPVSSNISGKAKGKLQASVRPSTATMPEGQRAPSELTVQLSFDDIELTADSVRMAAVEKINVDVQTITPEAIRVKSVDVTGVEVRTARTAEGYLSFAGVNLVPVESAPVAAPAKPEALPATQPAGGAAPIFELQALNISDVAVNFYDAAQPGDRGDPTRLAFELNGLTVEHFSTVPSTDGKPAVLKVRATVPGIARELSADGTAQLATEEKTIELDFGATGIAPEAIAPYLEQLGISSTLVEGAASGRLNATLSSADDGSINAALGLRDITFTDQNVSLFSLPLVDVQQVAIAPQASKITLGHVTVEGPVLPVRRSEAGVVSLLGLQLTPADGGSGNVTAGASAEATPVAVRSVTATATTRPATTAAATAPASQPAEPVTLPVIEIVQLDWRGASITLDDLSSPEGPLHLALQDVDVSVSNVLLDPAAEREQKGDILASFRAPGIVESIRLTGHVAAKPERIAFELKPTATGLTADAIRPLLAAIGIEPVLADGRFNATVSGELSLQNGTLLVSAGARDVELADGDTEWLALDALTIQNASFDGRVASVDAIAIDKPRARVQRDEAGLVSAGGFKMLPPKPVAQIASAPAEPSPTRVDLSLPIVARLNSFTVSGANLHLQDAAVLPAADLQADVDVALKNVVVGEEADPATLAITLSSPGVVDALKVNGRFSLAPSVQHVELSVLGTGVSGQAIEPYLPPNIVVANNQGEFAASLSAAIAPHADGGSAVALTVSDVRLNDGNSADFVAGVNQVKVAIERIDLPGKRIAIKEITVDGAMLSAEQSADGLAVLGLKVLPAPVRPVPVPRAAPEPIAAEGASDVNQLVQAANVKPPLVTLEKLSIKADRLAFRSPDLAQEVAVTGLSLTNATPIEQLGDDPQSRPPFDLKLQATVDQLIDAIAVDAHLAPLAAEPGGTVALDVSGIRGEQLIALLPAVAEQISGEGLSDGRFTSNAEVQLAYTRRGMIGIDTTRDITADVTITNTRLTQQGNDKPLAGVDEVRAERIRYSPATGSIIVRSLEVTKPIAQIVRDQAGLHAFGFTIKPAVEGAPSDATAAETTALPAEVEPSAPAPEAVADASTAGRPAGEVRIDQFTISGADIRIEDRLGTVPTILPIEMLDVEVKGLSSRATEEPRPIRFSAIVGAGKVELPNARGELSERPVFAEASASGNLVLVPSLEGYAKASLSGLEMTALRGLASQSGIEVNGGTFDFRTDVRMQGDEAFNAKLYPTFNELRVTEPPGGPVQSILQLPAPLDVVLATLESTDGSISIPVTVPIQSGQINTGAIVGSAIASIARVTAEAMVAAPLKAAKMVAMLGGADVSSARTRGIEPVVIDFSPGESGLTAAQQEEVDKLIDRLRSDATLEVTIQHTLGAADVAVVAQRSNPTADESQVLAEVLRRRKLALQSEQAERGNAVRVMLASGNAEEAAQAIEALRANSIELNATEDSMNQMLDLLRPGADRQAERRTKSASILLGDLRLRAIQQRLLDSETRSISERVRKANALFNPAEDPEQPGRVTIVIVRRAK